MNNVTTYKLYRFYRINPILDLNPKNLLKRLLTLIPMVDLSVFLTPYKATRIYDKDRYRIKRIYSWNGFTLGIGLW